MRICRGRLVHRQASISGFRSLSREEKMPHLRTIWLARLTAVVVLALMPTPGWAQNVYGTISGTVTDASGAVVANATVTLTSLDTGEKRSITTDTSGNYTFVNILPDRYR